MSHVIAEAGPENAWARGLLWGMIMAVVLVGGVALPQGPPSGELVAASISAHSSDGGSGAARDL